MGENSETSKLTGISDGNYQRIESLESPMRERVVEMVTELLGNEAMEFLTDSGADLELYCGPNEEEKYRLNCAGKYVIIGPEAQREGEIWTRIDFPENRPTAGQTPSELMLDGFRLESGRMQTWLFLGRLIEKTHRNVVAYAPNPNLVNSYQQHLGKYRPRKHTLVITSY